MSSPTTPPNSHRLLRLRPHPFSILPPHPELDNNTTTTTTTEERERPSLHTFLATALSEALYLLDTTIPDKFIKRGKLRASPPAAAGVELSTYNDTTTTTTSTSTRNGTTSGISSSISSSGDGDGKGEFWVCRHSIHNDTDTNEQGTASWTEFEKGLRENHSRNEMEYTSSVSSVEGLLAWEGVPLLMPGGWSEVDMHVNMITHTFKPGFLISPRTFISCVISAILPETTSASKGFVTVQIPLSHTLNSGSGSGSGLPSSLRQRIISLAPKDTVFASYASVERVVHNPAAPTATTGGDTGGTISWTMATTSDAGGSIPQWVQRSWTMGGVPKAVVKDVGLFIGWVQRRRRDKKTDTGIRRGAEEENGQGQGQRQGQGQAA